MALAQLSTTLVGSAPPRSAADARSPRNSVLSAAELFWQSLLLLEFDVRAQQHKHHVAFNDAMFRTSNVKGMIVRFRFCFCFLLSCFLACDACSTECTHC